MAAARMSCNSDELRELHGLDTEGLGQCSTDVVKLTALLKLGGEGGRSTRQRLGGGRWRAIKWQRIFQSREPSVKKKLSNKRAGWRT
jgi:hypothetical protein